MKKLFLTLSIAAALFASDAKVKVVFDAGGSTQDPYATVVSNGAKAAAKDLGVDLTLQYSDWDPNKMLQNFNTAMGTNPDAIVIMGHPGNELYAPYVKQARDRGIYVTSVDTSLNDLREKYTAEGFGYAGVSYTELGTLIANAAISKVNLAKGDEIILWGLKEQPTRGIVTRKVIELLEAAGVVIHYQEISPEINKDTSLGHSVFAGLITSYPNSKVFIVLHGGLSGASAGFAKTLNSKIPLIASSVNPGVLKGIEEGQVLFSYDPQPYLQGYLGVLQAYMSKKYGFAGINALTGGGFVDKNNIGAFKELVKKGIR